MVGIPVSACDLYMKKKPDRHRADRLETLRKNEPDHRREELDDREQISCVDNNSCATSLSIMMKLCVLTLLGLVCLASCQRPPYAGSSNRYPVVLPQFVENQNTLAAPADSGIVNRIGDDGVASAPTTSTIPPNLPIEAGGDYELIKRIMTWPREKQPFWYINWVQIQEHIGDGPSSAQQAQLRPNLRPTFAG